MAGATAPKSAMFKMFNMLGIRLEPELEERLDSLAKETGRSKSYYARQAIRQYLEDREDYLKGIAALERREPTITLEELERRLGLDDCPDRCKADQKARRSSPKVHRSFSG
jgi:RHH-type rel operon transcriptional repressor/antitoxin RelB